MTANIVYSVVKALPPEEQRRLFALLQEDLLESPKIKSTKKPKLITDAEADAYLIKDVFNKKEAKNWEFDFNIDLASESTETPTSKSGKIFLEVFGYPILNRKGGLEYVLLQHNDITARTRFCRGQIG